MEIFFSMFVDHITELVIVLYIPLKPNTLENFLQPYQIVD